MLDEECIMPKATDVSFTEKVAGLWELPKGTSASAAKSAHLGTSKFRSLRFGKGFVVKHYAGDVEYSTKDWLQKNKDPINDAVARLLSQSDVPAIKTMFAEYAEDTTSNVGGRRIKRGAFRTVGQRHKEQLGQLMQQLASTQPHFVRCIVPNTAKKPGKVDVNIVLDQLRCNGVIEGIRIARLGYPNRLPFAEFRQRYEVLVPGVIPQGYMDGRKAAELIAIALELDPEFYAVGTTKIFFKAGILAELEERRDNLLTDIFRRFQAAARMHIHRRRINKLINRAQAVRTIQRNARAYIELRDWPWWSLYTKVRPLLAATRTDDELAKKRAELTMAKERAERDEAEKVRLEELRNSLLAEKEKVENDLSSERSLAIEKEQMLARSKAHEAELNDRVSELEAEMEKLNLARDNATATNEKQAADLAEVQLQSTQLLKKIELLERLNAEQKARETDVLGKLSKEIEATTKTENEKNDLARQLEDLRRDVAKRDDVSRRAKEKVDGHAAELEKLLSEEKKKSESLASQVASLNKDVKRRDADLRDVQEMSKAHESTISAKQIAITDLANKHSASVKAHEASEATNARLKSEIENLKATIASRDKDKQADGAERTKLLKSLDELRTVMEAKTSEGIKLREAEKSRQAEIAGLRSEAAQHQKSLEDFKRATGEAASKMRLEVESLRQRHSAAEKELKATTERLRSKTSEAEKFEAAAATASKTQKGVQAELESTRNLLKSTEKELRTAQVKGEVSYNVHAPANV
jgi:myosin protein heavy chain